MIVKNITFIFGLILVAGVAGGSLVISAEGGTGKLADNAPGYDIIIRSGTVIDGFGGEGFVADIGIAGGKISLVGDSAGATAATILDASGLIVAPGFIDPHSHADLSIDDRENRSLINLVVQGVTTIVGGPDGWYPPAAIRKFRDNFGGGGLGTNIAFYVGHNGIRRQVMGGAKGAPSAEELTAMKALVREGMELGALGLSTGLMYEPGLFSTTDEVVALAREVAPFDGIYDSHVRNPVKAFVASHAEAIEIGRRAGIPVKLGHLKAVALRNRGAIREVIAMVEKARSEGHEVVSDQYPYDGAATARLSDLIIIPGEDGAPGKGVGLAEIRRMLGDPEQRARLKVSSENGIDGGFAWLKATGYDAIRIVSTPDRPELIGKYLIALAEERGVDPFDALADLIAELDDTSIVTLGAIAEEDVRMLMVQPWNMIGSDGAHVANTAFPAHPRSTGTFPRVLGHYVREVGLLSLAEAIRRMTVLPADFLRLYDRGRIAAGKAADIVVFDAARIAARSTWEQPHLLSTGVIHVIVNGVLVLRDEELTGNLPGEFVERQGLEK